MAGPLLFCFDGSDNARGAIRAAGEALPGAKAFVATAWQPFPHVSAWSPGLSAEMSGGLAELDRQAEERAQACAEEGCQLAREAGFDAQPVLCRAEGAIWAALLHRADDLDASIVVVGRRGLSSVAAAVLGSVSLGVVNHSKRPVLVAPTSDEN